MCKIRHLHYGTSIDSLVQSPQSFERGDFYMKKPTCKLIEADGNIFNLIGIASRTLRRNDLPEQADEMGKRILGGEAGSYDAALRIIMEYVEIE